MLSPSVRSGRGVGLGEAERSIRPSVLSGDTDFDQKPSEVSIPPAARLCAPLARCSWEVVTSGSGLSDRRAVAAMGAAPPEMLD